MLPLLVICISRAICWRSDIGALLALRPPDPAPPPAPPIEETPRGREEAGIAAAAGDEAVLALLLLLLALDVRELPCPDWRIL